MLHPGECIYQIVTDRFCEGNPAGRPRAELLSSGADNLRKYLGGDWAGIIARIQDGYLTGMGFSAILISQPAENIDVCMKDEEGTASYHRYWPRDFLRPNPLISSLIRKKVHKFCLHWLLPCRKALTPASLRTFIRTAQQLREPKGTYRMCCWHRGLLMSMFMSLIWRSRQPYMSIPKQRRREAG